MSAPRIFIGTARKYMLAVCTAESDRVCWHFYGATIAAAANAGREHLRTAHLLPRLREVLVTAPGYSRRCGVSLAACEATRCECAQDYPRAENGAQEAVQRFDLSHDCAHCGTASEICDRLKVGPCCNACAATGGCTHDNPMQATYDTTRSDT